MDIRHLNAQPELVLAHMHKLYHAEALVKFQRHVDRSGTMIPELTDGATLFEIQYRQVMVTVHLYWNIEVRKYSFNFFMKL